MFKLLTQSLSPALRFLGFFVKSSWHWIISIHLLCFSLEEFFTGMAELHQTNARLAILCHLGAFFTVLTYSLFLALLVPARWAEWKDQAPLRSFGFIIKKFSLPLITEGLRVFVRVLLWALAFILPGLFQYYRLSLVPFIVVINKDYDRGALDALKHSHELIKGHDFGYIVILLLLMVLDMSYEVVGLLLDIPNLVGVKILISTLTLPLSLYSYAVWVEIYGLLEQKLIKT